jgi:hypothetical protein
LEPRPATATEAVTAAVTKRLQKDLEISTGYKGPLKSRMGVKEAERAIKNLDLEHGMTWDASGNAILRQTSGKKRALQITAKEWEHVRKHPGSVWTHNHPNGNPSLSSADIHFSMLSGAHEARAVTSARGGMVMKVTDQAKWKAAASKSLTKFKLKSIEEDAKEAARRAVTRFMTGPSGDKTRRWDVYFEAFARESERGYNKMGRKHGFKVERL